MNVTSAEQRVVSQPAVKEASEWWFVWGTIIFVLIVTTIPYFYAYLSTPSDKQFMGIMVNVPDHMQYFSWMRELSSANLSANKLTPEPNEPVFFNLLWWGLGRLGSILGLTYAGVFQILRVTGAILFLLLAYRVCSWFLAEKAMRRVAFLLIVFSAGFGWVLVILKYALNLSDLPYPLLVFVSEPNTFFNILAFPHFIAAALYIFIFDLVLRGQATKKLWYPVAAGFIALFLGWQHAYDLVLVYGILGTYGLFMLLRDKRIPWYLVKSGLIIGIISWWPALYSVLLTSLDPLWEEVLAQFDNAGVFTPNPLQLIVLLGPVFILALLALVKLNPFRLKKLDDNMLFLVAWFLANFALIYIPTDYQIHMLNGWQVPIAILATCGLFWYVIPFAQKTVQKSRFSWSSKTVQNGVIVVVLMLVIPTNVYLWLWRFVDLRRQTYPFYLYQEELDAMDWLEENAVASDVVLSSETIGQFLPAMTGTHAYLAHWAQTVNYFDKRDKVQQLFLQSTSDAQREQILQQFSVDYIFYGPVEQEMGQYQPANSPFLQEVYASPHVKIYQISE